MPLRTPCIDVASRKGDVILASTPNQPVAKVVTAFDRPCIPADGVAMDAHTPGRHPNRALSGGRRDGLGPRATFITGCYEYAAFSDLKPAGPRMEIRPIPTDKPAPSTS